MRRRVPLVTTPAAPQRPAAARRSAVHRRRQRCPAVRWLPRQKQTENRFRPPATAAPAYPADPTPAAPPLSQRRGHPQLVATDAPCGEATPTTAAKRGQRAPNPLPLRRCVARPPRQRHQHPPQSHGLFQLPVVATRWWSTRGRARHLSKRARTTRPFTRTAAEQTVAGPLRGTPQRSIGLTSKINYICTVSARYIDIYSKIHEQSEPGQAEKTSPDSGRSGRATVRLLCR